MGAARGAPELETHFTEKSVNIVEQRLPFIEWLEGDFSDDIRGPRKGRASACDHLVLKTLHIYLDEQFLFEVEVERVQALDLDFLSASLGRMRKAAMCKSSIAAARKTARNWSD